jgi:hypothetical protein
MGSSTGTQSTNVAIGYRAGRAATSTSSVYIGANAGNISQTVSNVLYIANSTTATPLIYGLFTGTGAGVTINSQSTAGVPLIVKGIASQASNLQEWQNSSGTALTTITSVGAITQALTYSNAATGTSAYNGTSFFNLTSANAFSYNGMQHIAHTSNTNHNQGVVRGGSFNAFGRNLAGSTVNQLIGFAASGYVVSGGANYTNVTGANITAYHDGAGTVATMSAGTFAAFCSSASTGVVSTIIGGNFSTTNSSGNLVSASSAGFFGSPGGAGAITNQFGVNIANQGRAGVVNAYGVNIANITGATTNNFAILTNAGNIVFNEGGDANTDFRVEGDTDANLLFVDASTDRVGIGKNNPAYKFDVTGEINSTAGYRINGTAGATGSFTTVDLKTVTVTNGIITQIL